MSLIGRTLRFVGMSVYLNVNFSNHSSFVPFFLPMMNPDYDHPMLMNYLNHRIHCVAVVMLMHAVYDLFDYNYLAL